MNIADSITMKAQADLAADWSKFDEDRQSNSDAHTKENVSAIKGYGYKSKALSDGSTLYQHENGSTLIQRPSGAWHGLSHDGAHLDTTKIASPSDTAADHSDYARGFARTAATR